MLGYFNKTISR